MAATASPVVLPALFDRPLSLRPLATRRSLFGDVAIVIFLLAQCLDGVFTYVGVLTYGLGIEANPLIAALMATFGHGVGLTGAKVIASLLGIGLHVLEIHRAVAMLAGFYAVVAVFPWALILLG